MSKFDKAILAQWRELAADMERSGEGGSAPALQRSHRGLRGEGSGADDPMSHREALEKIVADAREYESVKKRFLKVEGMPDGEGHKGYREGVRDGKNQARRIAELALEAQA